MVILRIVHWKINYETKDFSLMALLRKLLFGTLIFKNVERTIALFDWVKDIFNFCKYILILVFN